MLKRINWKGILYGFICLLSLSGLVLLMSFIEVKKGAQKCKDVKVILPGRNNFIERDEVDRILYADMDGIVHVQIRQRVPILRVINMANVHFYIDGNGIKIPLSDNFTAKVLVANGFIDEDFSGKVDTLNSKLAKDLYRTAQFIKADTLWDNQIEQLFVDLKGDIEMVPRVGDHKIILGNADSLQTKFRNLFVFYKKAMPKVGWDTYKSINLKYANQIVCGKNKFDTTKIVTEINRLLTDSLKLESQESTKN